MRNWINNLVSVILVTHNYSRYVDEAVNSVLNQSYRNLELITIDDGSTDDTYKILGKHQNDTRFTLVRKEHTGNVGRLRNEGVKLAKGSLVSFIDGDDVWRENKIKEQLYWLDFYQIVCSNAEIIDENNKLISSGFFNGFVDDFDINLQSLVNRNYVLTSSVLLHRSLFDSFGGFDEKVGIRGEDYLLWLKVAEQNRIRFINKLLVKYRIHSQNLSFHSADERVNLLCRTLSIRSAYFENSDLGVSQAAKVGCIPLYKELTRINFGKRNYKKAREYCANLIRLYPSAFSLKYLKFLLYFLIIGILGFILGDRR